ncbi:A disintegrin and metalloproteinase with thrombospondin motifs adt-1-like [Ruditapes philippinarum]|uniref:A disintegrin and metalloproteinase with thrombospondin motifs adt-1-like n=1 Tax=Ruditapes philippinarum TaxID=129788 RepID=UPI00295AD874|nr:A disintegrin and metalloproteinase with thrombospondin motifs adt-1-like [Ruditapes philippinarum]
MKPISFIIGWVFIFAVSAISWSQSLECFSCTDAVNTRECKSVEKCEEGQVCFKKREYKSQVQYDMGCIDKESCGRSATRKNGSEIAKMSVDKSNFCYECCSKDKCNDNLCTYPPRKLHGGWSSWDVWGECSATCGIGMQSRKRSCTNPSPDRFGDHCFGNRIEYTLCNTGSCASLRNIYEIVSQGQTELRLDLTAAGGEHVYETFQNFHLSDSPYYTLHIDKGVGTAGDK